MLTQKLLAAAGGAEETLYVDDVFSAYTYTGTGAAGNTITNGIDLAGKGGMVWIKGRTSAVSHNVFDTARGPTKLLQTNIGYLEQSDTSSLTSFNASGFSLGLSNQGNWVNQSAAPFISWTFLKAPKFFDVVTWTGNATNRTISHALGQEVGMILVARTDSSADWQVYHRSLANTEYMVLNSTVAKATGATRWNSTTATTSVFSVGTDATVNASGGTYVAYLFAHDSSADGIVQCGSFTTTAGDVDISLGWEPQYVMYKSTSATGLWEITDTSRALAYGTVELLYANSSSAADNPNPLYANVPTATGFKARNSYGLGAGVVIAYLAIRRPNKPPTVGTQVYNAIARNGTGAAATVTGVGFAPDVVLSCSRGTLEKGFFDRLRGSQKYLQPTATLAEQTDSISVTAFNMDGISVGSDTIFGSLNFSGTYVTNFFKRAVGVMDICCYTGTGSVKTEAHNLGVVPELMIIKNRDTAQNWGVYANLIGPGHYLSLNQTLAAQAVSSPWNNTFPTASVFTVGVSGLTNTSTSPHVAYLFATKAGISKVGSYTGNGSSLTLNMGFTTGARFFMVKRTDATGDWFVFDTTRGIIAGNDGHLSLNTTVAEVTTDDSVDPDTTGLVVNQVAATNINVTSATYIYLAFA